MEIKKTNYYCEVCNEYYSSKSKLQRHFKTNKHKLNLEEREKLKEIIENNGGEENVRITETKIQLDNSAYDNVDKSDTESESDDVDSNNESEENSNYDSDDKVIVEEEEVVDADATQSEEKDVETEIEYIELKKINLDIDESENYETEYLQLREYLINLKNHQQNIESILDFNRVDCNYNEQLIKKYGLKRLLIDVIKFQSNIIQSITSLGLLFDNLNLETILNDVEE